jgi:hypothetical protein
MSEFKFDPNHFGIIMESLGEGNMNILVGHELDDLSDEERNNCLDLLTGLRLMLERGPEVVGMLGGMMRMVTEIMDNDVDFEPDPDLIDAIGERLSDNVLPFGKKKLN